MDDTGFVSWEKKEIFFSPGSPDPIWGPTELPGAFISARVKRPERKANHLPPSVQVKSEYNSTPIPLLCLQGVQGVCGENYSFLLLKILHKWLYIH